MSKEYRQLCDYGKKPEYHYEGCELYAALQNKRLAEKIRNDSPSYISESYSKDIFDAYDEYKNNDKW